MIFVGENIHIISKSVKEAIIQRNEQFLTDSVLSHKNVDYADLNVGPSKGDLAGTLPWLCKLVQNVSPNLKISLDTTNFEEMKLGLDAVIDKKNCILNSTSFDEPKFSDMLNLAVSNNCNLIALTMNRTSGIPQNSDGRLDIACQIYEKAMDFGFDIENLFFDSLILPVTAAQKQSIEVINSIKMLKESFDPCPKTIVGLSNISNGCASELRPIVNRTMAVLCFGAGLDAVIADAKDIELVRIFRMLEKNSPETSYDKLYIKLAEMIRNFGEIEDVTYDKTDLRQIKIMKTAKMLLGKTVYCSSFLDI